MEESFQNPIVLALLGGAAGAGIILFAAAILFLRSVRAEVRSLGREMFGILRKIEGLTATRRDQMLRQYDSVLEELSRRLPTAVASGAGDAIFQTESKLLSRLAELEPQMGEDAKRKEKLEELVRSMERLEQTVVNVTAETVHRLLVESREEIRREPEKLGRYAELHGSRRAS